MRKVYKYELPDEGSSGDTLELTLPSGAQPLTVQLQYDKPVLWALVEPDAPAAAWRIRVVSTGQVLDGALDHHYLGTVQFSGGRVVTHYFHVSADSRDEGAGGGANQGTGGVQHTGVQHTDPPTPLGSPVPIDRRPWRCPVCTGTGLMPGGFYTDAPTRNAPGQQAGQCRSCRGVGIVWG